MPRDPVAVVGDSCCDGVLTTVELGGRISDASRFDLEVLLNLYFLFSACRSWWAWDGGEEH